MDILILNWKDIKNPDVGGAEIILFELSKRLIADGHTVTWFCRSFRGAKPTENIDGIRVIRRGNRFTVYWKAYRYYRALSKKPDKVLDCVNTICWQTPLYVPAKKRIAYVNQLAREVLFYELPWGISHIAYLLERLEYVPYRKTRFVCYSNSVAKDLALFGIPLKHIKTFPIGIDTTRYVPGRKSREPLLLFVARLARMKRPDLCVEAMRIVVKAYPDAKLAIVGYGPMEKRLDGMISSYGLTDNVFLVNKDHLYFDKNPRDRKVTLMQEAWALILPSVKEGWGLVVTEAAACGTPAIVTNVTGLMDSVVRNKTGIILQLPITAQSLARAITSLISRPDQLLLLSKQAQAEARAYTWDRSYKEFLKVLEG